MKWINAMKNRSRCYFRELILASVLMMLLIASIF
jgi:hypothetical protein